MKNCWYDEILLLWWTFITCIEMQADGINHFDENSSLWWKFMALMKIHLVKADHSDEIPLVDENVKLLWKWLSLINKVIPLMAIHHFDENLSH